MQWEPGGETGSPLYNGNISGSTVAIKGISSDAPAGYTYKYDQLDRLIKMRQHTLSNSTTTWNSGSVNAGYKENYSYDGNGNILSLQRYAATGTAMDSLSYQYKRDNNNRLIKNRLVQLHDIATVASNPGELDGTSNYTYDEIGNLTADSKEGITAIDWTVYGKIKSITKSSGTISYNYDPLGNRVSKTAGGITTWYVRDAQGNQLGVYDKTGSGAIYWREQQLYGSSRLGMWRPDTTLAVNSSVIWGIANKRSYELSNHLGNVLAVISDNRSLVSGLHQAEVLSAQDYYPFGMVQPGRSLSSLKYRYGFNGKENDNEVKGEGNQQDYGMRIYDPRIGRFLSMDPIAADYPMLTPYQFASNRPIDGIDFDGLEFMKYRAWFQGEDKAGPVLALFANATSNTVAGAVNAVAETVSTVKNVSIYTYKVAKNQRNVSRDITNAVNGVSSSVREYFNKPISEQAQIAGNALTSPEAYGTAVGFFALGGGKTLNKGLTLGEDLLGLTARRSDLAIEWMGSIEKAKYVDISSPVFTQEIAVGTKLVQYRIVGQEGYVGDYFVFPGTTPEQIGLLSEKVAKTLEVTVNKPTKVLISTHKKNATYYADPSVKVEGAGKQIFSKELKNNIDVR